MPRWTEDLTCVDVDTSFDESKRLNIATQSIEDTRKSTDRSEWCRDSDAARRFLVPRLGRVRSASPDPADFCDQRISSCGNAPLY
mmetsp:Transcript_4689/g.10468  ORF Transcript_4689/g.10468 Transcript_4689/m.10468 type:complete len:85 (-) Transcript_4689:20-274(-)